MSSMTEINSRNPNAGLETLPSIGRFATRHIRHLRIAMEKHFPFFQIGNSTHPPEGSDINLLDSLAMSLKFT